MAVSFECVTLSRRSAAEMFDLARNIEVHTQLIEERGRFLAGRQSPQK
jgi:hypothetical protein